MARILKVTNYGAEESENTEVTISPGVIKVVSASTVPVMIQGRALKSVTVLMMDGDELVLVLSDPDLYKLEECVGFYDFDYA